MGEKSIFSLPIKSLELGFICLHLLFQFIGSNLFKFISQSADDNVITIREPEFIQVLVQMPRIPCLHVEIFTSAAILVTDHH